MTLRRPARLALHRFVQIPVRLKPHPQLRRRVQEPREAKGRIRCDASLPEDNFIQPVERNAQPLCRFELAKTERLQGIILASQGRSRSQSAAGTRFGSRLSVGRLHRRVGDVVDHLK